MATLQEQIEAAERKLADARMNRCYGPCGACDTAIQRAEAELKAVVAEETIELARREKEALRLLRLRQTGLRFANGVRYFLSKPMIGELRPGDIGEAGSCPITNSILDGDSGIVVQTQRRIVTVTDKTGNTVFHSKIPVEVQEFIAAFDSGQFPDLKSAPKMDLV